MSSSLKGRNLLLGVTGSIAAYKSAELTRQLKKSGADVQILMTSDAARFIPPLTLSTLSEKKVLMDIFPEEAEGTWTQHIELGLWADLFVIAPATAQTLAKLAHGFCDNMLTAVALAARCPLLICPAMDHDMFVHPATQSNLTTLEGYGYEILPPEHGELASGLVGTGRLPDPSVIVDKIAASFNSNSNIESEKDFSGKTVLVTAGPTREAIDPVRFLSNHSTGTMGFELAAEASRRGGDVTLISGPTSLATPNGVKRIDVVSAEEMAEAVRKHAAYDLIIMAAAVADYTPLQSASSKLKKKDDDLLLTFKRTEDILAGLGQNKRANQTLIGFALETDDIRANALRKLQKKNLDWIVLNSPNEAGAGFGPKTNKVTLFSAQGDEKAFQLMPKRDVAKAILDEISAAPIS